MIRTKAPISAAALNVPRPIHLATVSALPLTIDERYEPWVRFAAVISCPSYAPEVVGPRCLGVGGEPEFSHRGDRNRIDGESATPIIWPAHRAGRYCSDRSTRPYRAAWH